MWAMMPMFLQRSNGTCLGTLFLNFLLGSFSGFLVSQKRLSKTQNAKLDPRGLASS
jgi:hypothetical protein